MDANHRPPFCLRWGTLLPDSYRLALRRRGRQQRVDAVDIGLAEGSAVEGEQIIHRLPFQGWSGAGLWCQATLVPAIVTPSEQ
jgi:hypothetical protein